MCDYIMGRWRRLTPDKAVISSGTRSAMYELLHSPFAWQRLLCKSTVPKRTRAYRF